MAVPAYMRRLLDRKYDNMDKDAQSDRIRANASSQDAQTRAGLAVGQRGLDEARARQLGAETRQIAPNAQAARGLQGAQAFRSRMDANTSRLSANTERMMAPSRMGLMNAQSQLAGMRAQELPFDSRATRALQGAQTRAANLDADTVEDMRFDPSRAVQEMFVQRSGIPESDEYRRFRLGLY